MVKYRDSFLTKCEHLNKGITHLHEKSQNTEDEDKEENKRKIGTGHFY